MRKGISPIVAVVLLIAIAVIAAVGLYFWVGGLATKQPTPDTPIIISGQKVTCNTSTGYANDTITVLIQNLDSSATLGDENAETLYIQADDGTLTNTSSFNIPAGQQASVTFGNTSTNGSKGYGGNLTAGDTYSVYGTSGVGQAAVIC